MKKILLLIAMLSIAFGLLAESRILPLQWCVLTVNETEPATALNYHTINAALEQANCLTTEENIKILVYQRPNNQPYTENLSLFNPEKTYYLTKSNSHDIITIDGKVEIASERYDSLVTFDGFHFRHTSAENFFNIVKRSASILNCYFHPYSEAGVINAIQGYFECKFSNRHLTISNCTFDGTTRDDYAISVTGTKVDVDIITSNFNETRLGIHLQDVREYSIVANNFTGHPLFNANSNAILTRRFKSTTEDAIIVGNIIDDYDSGINFGTSDIGGEEGATTMQVFLNRIYNTNIGIYACMNSDVASVVSLNLIVANDMGIAVTEDAEVDTGISTLSVNSNTIVSNNGSKGIYFKQITSGYYRGSASSNIIRGFDDAVNSELSSATTSDVILYSNCYNGRLIGDFEMDDNFQDDPMFIDPSENNYYLSHTSPCINSGHPAFYDSDNDGILFEYLDDTDQFGNSDGHVGCFGPQHNTIDTKWLKNNKYNWIGFPRLEGSTETISQVINPNTLITPVEYIKIKFENLYNGEVWETSSMELNQTGGYKLYPSSTESTEGFVELRIDGTLYDSTNPITLEAGVDNFVCFTYPTKLAFDQVFQDGTTDYFDDIVLIKSDSWYYYPETIQRDGTSPSPLPSRPCNTINNFEYGKAYIIRVSQDITLNNGWFIPEDPTVREETVKDAKQFTIAYKEDYEAMDIVNIPDNVEEIAVFEGEECVGAAVVENNEAQVLVFSNRANREEIPFALEFYTGERAFQQADYQVFDENMSQFIDKPVLSNRQQYSLVRIKSDTQANKIMQLDASAVYPNPFTRSDSRSGVHLSYNITKTAKVTASVYNIKGQKVADVFSGTLDAGKHTITWNGLESSGKVVGTGIYFMKVNAGQKSVSRKFVLMK